MQKNRKYLFLNDDKLKWLFLFFPRIPTPKGVPHELHTNLPDKARSALRLELPQTKHLFERIKLKLFQTFIKV